MSKVFIIDDDPIHQRIAQILITKNGLFDNVISYLEAESALNFIKEHLADPAALPDVILLDLNMPGMTGWNFLDAFGSISAEMVKTLRIFIVSSSVDEKDRLRSEEYKTVSGFICKPLSVDDLRLTLK